MKLQKYLSQAGICSRRKGEEYILKWMVKVNGVKAHIWQVVNPETDKVECDGQIVRDQKNFVYYKFHKPRGVVTTNRSSETEESVADYIQDIPERVFPIWRLDKDTTGLLILTNDGRLSNYLMHPRYEHTKEYVVEVYGKIEDDALEKMRRGMFLADLNARTRPAEVTRLATGRLSIVLREGKNRQIRRMIETVGHEVKRLKRVRVENIRLWSLPEWAYTLLTRSELTMLLEKILPHTEETTDEIED